MKTPRSGSLAEEIQQFLDTSSPVPPELRSPTERPGQRAQGEPPAACASAHFLVVRPRNLEALAIPDGEVTIGRAPECGLVLDSVDVSLRHCRLAPMSNGAHEVVDLRSARGVVVNGLRVDSCELVPFDRVGIGDYELLYLGRQTAPEEVVHLLRPHYPENAPTLSPPERLRVSLRERLTWLTIMFQELRSEEEMAPLLDALLDELVREPACARSAMVVLVDPAPDGELRAVKLRNAPPDHVRHRTLAQYLPLVRRALEEGVVEAETPLGPATVCVPMRSHPRVAAAGGRLPRAGHAEGALLFSQAEGGLGLEERLRFEVLARQVAVLLSSADLQRQAMTDGLTGLTNRGHADQIVRHERARSTRTGEPLTALLIDLDDFKAINDSRGHAAGDDVLRAVAALLRRELRLSDCAARWGGEEFLVVLPGTDRAGGLRVAEKLLAAFRGGSFAGGASVTASIGVACWPQGVEELRQLLDCADLALYRAKEAGKNRAVAFAPTLPAHRPEPPRPGRITIRLRQPTPAARSPSTLNGQAGAAPAPAVADVAAAVRNAAGGVLHDAR